MPGSGLQTQRNAPGIWETNKLYASILWVIKIWEYQYCSALSILEPSLGTSLQVTWHFCDFKGLEPCTSNPIISTGAIKVTYAWFVAQYAAIPNPQMLFVHAIFILILGNSVLNIRWQITYQFGTLIQKTGNYRNTTIFWKVEAI